MWLSFYYFAHLLQRRSGKGRGCNRRCQKYCIQRGKQRYSIASIQQLLSRFWFLPVTLASVASKGRTCLPVPSFHALTSHVYAACFPSLSCTPSHTRQLAAELRPACLQQQPQRRHRHQYQHRHPSVCSFVVTKVGIITFGARGAVIVARISLP